MTKLRRRLNRPPRRETCSERPLPSRAGSDPAARDALHCHQQARQVALNAEGKAAQVLSLLRRHADDRVLVFCEYTSVDDSLSHRLLLPSVTYRTPAAERRETLHRFRTGGYTKLVTGRVLNEDE